MPVAATQQCAARASAGHGSPLGNKFEQTKVSGKVAPWLRHNSSRRVVLRAPSR